VAQITEAAIKKILDLDRSWICLSIVKGGCAEYKYAFSFQKPEVYQSFFVAGIEIIIPSDQIEELRDVAIDYRSTLVYSEFIVSENPYFSQICGCGISVK